MRLFAALPLSPEVIERLTRLRLRFSAPGDGLRWSTPEQWHITLQFYGEVDEARAACLRSGLAQMAVAEGPELCLDGLGWFPAKGILYASVAVTSGLVSLQQQVVDFGRTCGVVPESRPFRPHVTLARSKGRTGLKTLQRLGTPDLPAFGPDMRWPAEELHLVQSTLSPHGALYAVFARRQLKTEAPPSMETR